PVNGNVNVIGNVNSNKNAKVSVAGPFSKKRDQEKNDHEESRIRNGRIVAEENNGLNDEVDNFFKSPPETEKQSNQPV
ncbi:7746_t:CDS:2, partial [Ambispora gerdemannii]